MGKLMTSYSYRENC